MSILHAYTTHKRTHIQKFSHMYVYESGEKERERERIVTHFFHKLKLSAFLHLNITQLFQ